MSLIPYKSHNQSSQPVTIMSLNSITSLPIEWLLSVQGTDQKERRRGGDCRLTRGGWAAGHTHTRAWRSSPPCTSQPGDPRCQSYSDKATRAISLFPRLPFSLLIPISSTKTVPILGLAFPTWKLQRSPSVWARKKGHGGPSE